MCLMSFVLCVHRVQSRKVLTRLSSFKNKIKELGAGLALVRSKKHPPPTVFCMISLECIYSFVCLFTLKSVKSFRNLLTEVLEETLLPPE